MKKIMLLSIAIMLLGAGCLEPKREFYKEKNKSECNIKYSYYYDWDSEKKHIQNDGCISYEDIAEMIEKKEKLEELEEKVDMLIDAGGYVEHEECAEYLANQFGEKIKCLSTIRVLTNNDLEIEYYNKLRCGGQWFYYEPAIKENPENYARCKELKKILNIL